MAAWVDRFRPMVLVLLGAALVVFAVDCEIVGLKRLRPTPSAIDHGTPGGAGGGDGGASHTSSGGGRAGHGGAPGGGGAAQSGGGGVGGGGVAGAGGLAGAGGAGGGNHSGGCQGTGGGGLGDVVPDFQLLDVNDTSPRYNTLVSPRDYLQQISAWYFGSAT